MRRFMTWLVALGLAATPALASSSANGADGAAATTAASPAASVEPEAGAKKESAPLYFKIGDAKFTPGGFADFTTFFRGTNVGSGLPTAFGTIPYNNSLAARESETRMSAQGSRLALKMETNVGVNKVLGYVETDFVGNSAANQFVTSNSMTLRMRMYLADVQRGKWEIMGGQAWTLMTPSRKGLGVLPADLLIPMVGDANYVVGFPWARQAQFRLAYHPTDNTVMAVSIENPQQFIGSAGSPATVEVVMPSAFSTQLASQFDGGAGVSGTPNLHPDIVAKIAHDQKVGTRALHLEAGGIVRSFKVANQVYTVGAATPLSGPYFSHTITEGGLTAGGTFELFKNFTLIENAVWGAGTGRYLAALAPDVVVRPVALTATTFDTALSPVHSGSVMSGFEWLASKNTMLAAYYGGIYAARNAFQDVTSGSKPNVGFGGAASTNSTSANRAVQEGTLSLTQTFWKSPTYGALQFISQGSYLTRAPWYVAPTAPKNAHVFMSTAGIRYILP